jgi:hypothetical protein
MILAGVFIACGGGNNFSSGDGGDEFSSTGPGEDATMSSGGGDAFQSIDNYVPPKMGKDSSPGDTGTGGMCSMTCTTDSFCAGACPTTSTYCCDVPTGACYPTSLSTCPPADSGSGSSGSIYG